MKIATLSPFLAEAVWSLGLKESLCAISYRCEFPEGVKEIPVITKPRGNLSLPGLAGRLCADAVDLVGLRNLKPDIILTRFPDGDESKIPALNAELNQELGFEVKLLQYDPKTLEQITGMFEELGKKLDVLSAAHDICGRVRAQCKDWVDNFYPRTRGKKVTFLVGTDPLVLGGLWLPQLIQMTSAVSQHKLTGEKHKRVEWEQIVEYRPDVIVIAPAGQELNAVMKRISYFESLPDWEEIPAVKRGEVIFADGKKFFHSPGPRIIESMGVLVSAIAGLESGYITERGSFQRLRWVEMHRHEYQ